ncbi:recombinase family protein [Bacillus sp. DX4.1]|uniref:recombinase family protein n=1 Tax=Bacillus sp. DX4.1 TaxID=3055867 RepID=UPI0025A189D1|nr:recombinase family protein [Bacillus sp. DX4.1]MDM5190462.1 recombinase family protein [Bacillus sp. DX4.1]
MGKFYVKLLCFLMGVYFIAGCSKAVDVAEEKEICKNQEECTRIGDEMVQKINKKMEGISKLEEPVEDIESIEEIKMIEQKKDDVESYFFLASYYIDNEEITDPYFEKLDKKRLNKVFAEDKEAKDEVVTQHEDMDYHGTLWEIYRTLIPAKYRESMKEFAIVTDGYDGMVAHVAQNPEEPKDWVLSLDTLDSGVNIEEVMKTLIHETAHVLTLNDAHIPVDKKYLQAFEEDKDISSYKEKCKNLFLQEGCTKADSYINKFHESFWKQIEKEWQEKQIETNLEAQIQFFEEKHDQFVSEYGTTNVAEDIADTFTAFILQDSKQVKEGEELKYKKMAFFYQFPELVKMRAEVLTGLYKISKEVKEI